MTVIIGFDPGMTGALSIIDGSNVFVYDTPMKVVGKGSKKKKIYDKEAMANLLIPYRDRKDVVGCGELVHSMTGQGVSSSFNFGRGLGLWEGIFAGVGISLSLVAPQTWKRKWADRLMVNLPKSKEILDLEKNSKLTKEEKVLYKSLKKEWESKRRKAKEKAKDAARELASEMHPQLKSLFSLKKHDGRAESLLIAEYKKLELMDGNIEKKDDGI